jgi:hypothetical protein
MSKGNSKGLEPRIKQLNAEGQSFGEIAKNLGCSFGIVYYHLTPGFNNGYIVEKIF